MEGSILEEMLQNMITIIDKLNNLLKITNLITLLKTNLTKN